MKYIGTSLGGCLQSLMAGEVSEEEVMFIVTRTFCPTYDSFMQVVEQYYSEGIPVTRNTYAYELCGHDLTKVKELATRLYYTGRIHQPRVFSEQSRRDGHSFHYNHPARLGNGLWMEVVPTNDNSTPAVIDAYEKYKVLDRLTRD